MPWVANFRSCPSHLPLPFLNETRPIPANVAFSVLHNGMAIHSQFRKGSTLLCTTKPASNSSWAFQPRAGSQFTCVFEPSSRRVSMRTLSGSIRRSNPLVRMVLFCGRASKMMPLWSIRNAVYGVPFRSVDAMRKLPALPASIGLYHSMRFQIESATQP